MVNSNVFRNISYGLYVISTVDQERPTGCIANSIMQITSSPATLALSMNHDNFTNSCIKKSGVFGVSILSEKSDPSLIGTFGFQSGKDTDKFAAVAHTVKDGLCIVEDTCGYITCRVIDTMETSTHTVFLGEIIGGDTLKSDPAMTYSYYHTVIKGKSPKNAPTYIPEEDEAAATAKVSGKEVTYVCSTCGYVYEGDTAFDQLPEDYVCPVCMQAKGQFVVR